MIRVKILEVTCKEAFVPKLESLTGHWRRPLWPRGLKCGSAAAFLLGFWVRIPPGTWIFVCCGCCVLSGRCRCDKLITRPEESYRLWCVVLCDLETSRMRRLWSALGRSATGKQDIGLEGERNTTRTQKIVGDSADIWTGHFKNTVGKILRNWILKEILRRYTGIIWLIIRSFGGVFGRKLPRLFVYKCGEFIYWLNNW